MPYFIRLLPDRNILDVSSANFFNPCHNTESMELVRGINCIYGPPASGKTNLCLFKAANTKGKVIYLDSEHTFSADRIKDFNKDVNLEDINVIKIDSFEKQGEAIKELKNIRNAKLIIIDSLTKYYRKELQEQSTTNKEFLEQLRNLRALYKDKDCSILLTSQVYNSNDKIMPVGGKPIRDFSKCLIKLSNENQRMLEVEKHPKLKKSIRPFLIETGKIRLL